MHYYACVLLLCGFWYTLVIFFFSRGNSEGHSRVDRCISFACQLVPSPRQPSRFFNFFHGKLFYITDSSHCVYIMLTSSFKETSSSLLLSLSSPNLLHPSLSVWTQVIMWYCYKVYFRRPLMVFTRSKNKKENNN